ncbi:MAG: potassium channel protein [Pseudomonadota bacterium]|nr:potassium channel protein [Pseudomonadota bacterium]
MLIRGPILLASLALLAVLVLGTFGYVAIEGWAPFDAFWMVVITLTTIGFGEVHPLSNAGRLFTLGVIVAGVGIGTYTMTQVTQLIIEGKMGEGLRARRRSRRMDALRDHYIVVGYGRLGQTIVEELLASGCEVCVIEKDASSIARVEALGHPTVEGDGANDDVLRSAGVMRARGIAIAVSSSAEAVFVTLSARELNPELNIVTRVADSEHAVKARRAGATSVVSPHTMGGWRMAHGLVRPHASSFLDLATLASHAEILLEEFQVPADSPVVGGSLGSLRLGEQHGVLVVAIRRADGRMIATPHATEVLATGDILIAIGAPARVRELGVRLQVAPRPMARGTGVRS